MGEDCGDGEMIIYAITLVLALFLVYTLAAAQWMRWVDERLETLPTSKLAEMWEDVDSDAFMWPGHWISTYRRWRR